VFPLRVKSLDGKVRYRTPTTVRGWPDLTLVHPEWQRIIYVELKKDGEYPTSEQRAVMETLVRAGAEVMLWRPKNWAHIEAVLRGG
jgi:hypothetical protein